MVTVDDLVLYCRIDLPEEGDSARAQVEALLDSLRRAAVTYLDNAGCSGTVSAQDTALYDQAVKALVLHWYDNRNAIAYNRSMVPLGLREIINQLKMEAMVHGS